MKYNKSIEVQYRGKSRKYTKNNIKTIYDPTKTWNEVIKDDLTEKYLYKFPGLSTLYININGVRMPTAVTEKDF